MTGIWPFNNDAIMAPQFVILVYSLIMQVNLDHKVI